METVCLWPFPGWVIRNLVGIALAWSSSDIDFWHEPSEVPNSMPLWSLLLWRVQTNICLDIDPAYGLMTSFWGIAINWHCVHWYVVACYQCTTVWEEGTSMECWLPLEEMLLSFQDFSRNRAFGFCRSPGSAMKWLPYFSLDLVFLWLHGSRIKKISVIKQSISYYSF